jgi:cytidylate kinase
MVTGRRHPDGIIITIDGPAGSGKSSTAKAVAAELRYRHLDSGAFYRAITLAALRAHIAPERWRDLTVDDLEGLAVEAVPEAGGYRMTIGEEPVAIHIRSREVSAHVPQMARVPAVRTWLLRHLREAGAKGGLVTDGRDMGTVVFPDAELKVFLVADPVERARRRLREHGITDPSEQQLREEAGLLETRDQEDSTRAVAPLARAADAVEVDTTGLEFSAQVAEIVRLARALGG